MKSELLFKLTSHAQFDLLKQCMDFGMIDNAHQSRKAQIREFHFWIAECQYEFKNPIFDIEDIDSRGAIEEIEEMIEAGELDELIYN